jgi:AbrB family looped-hinge helix DNA binding protein
MMLTISQKGWVVIPAELRKKYNLEPGRAVQVVDYGGVLALVPALADPVHQSAGLLHQPGDLLTDALLAERAAESDREAGENDVR